MVRDMRLPRTALGLVAGAALGVAGALIQAMTRNPLADPGILGVNAGAAFLVALAVGTFGVTALWDTSGSPSPARSWPHSWSMRSARGARRRNPGAADVVGCCDRGGPSAV